MKKLLFLFLVSVLFAQESIVVFHAGSLSVPFLDIKKEFELKYPQYSVKLEASGSRVAVRKIVNLGKTADIVASADYKIIDNLMIPNYAKFNIHFATNEMVVAFTNKSKYSDIINSKNWTDILLFDEVKIGHSNPNLDPCGYRSMLVIKLAQNYYNKKSFFKKLLGYSGGYKSGDERPSKVIVRPKETDLLGLLELGLFDYLFIYKSVAKQHNLQYITLPAEVSLKSAKFATNYKKVSFKISGKKPKEWIVRYGEPMVYGLTIIQNKKLMINKKGAKLFVNFILSPQGEAIMRQAGQNILNPLVIKGDARIIK